MGGRRSVEVRLLGDLEVRVDGRPVALPASKKTRALLGYLVVTGVPQLREHLCGLLWQGPDDPRGALRWSLTKLRAALGDECIEATRERAGFAADGVSVDTGAVKETLGAGLREVPTAAIERVAASFRGELLEGLDLPDCFRWHEWCVAQREAMRTAHVAVLTELVGRLEAEPERALVHARRRLAVDPIAEDAHVAVVRLLTALGRNREASDQVAACKRVLEQELGTAPSTALLAARVRPAGTREPSSPPPKQVRAAATAPAGAVAPGPAATPSSSHALPFFGRADELRALDGAWAETLRSASVGAVLVLGEPGIGKSRLVSEQLARSAAGGARVLRGRAFEAEMVRPYGPWIDALRPVAGGPEAQALAHDLAPILPELSRSDAARPVDRARVFDAIAGLLGAVSAKGGCIVVLDDLQWFEEASLALLHFVCRSTAPARVLVACTARAAELAENPNAQRLVRSMQRDGRLQELTLGPLDDAATTAIARAVDAGVDARRVADESGGNPFFALELARAARLGGAATASLDALVADNLDRLEPSARDLLPWAAALGRGFRLDALGQAAGVGDAELLRAVEELELRGVLRCDAPESSVAASSCLPALGAAASYDFAHDLVRGAAYRRLSSARRGYVHRRIATVLAERAATDPSLHGEVAHHAALAGDHLLAARSAARAAERCLGMFAHGEAARLAEIGLAHAARLDTATRVPLSVSMLKTKVVSGRWLLRATEIEQDLRALFAEAQEAGLYLEAGAALQWLAAAQRDRGDIEGARESTLRALDTTQARSHGATRGRQLAHTARCLALLDRDIDQAAAMLLEAMQLVPEHEKDFDWCWADALVREYCGMPESEVLHERALAFARRDGDAFGESECLIRLAQIALDRADPTAALAWCRELSAMAAKIREGSELVIAEALEALARAAASVRGAEAQLERAIGRLRDVDAKGMLAYVLAASADIDRAAGRLATAQSRADAALAAAEAVQRRTLVAAARASLAELALERGDRAVASIQLAAVADDVASPFGVSGHVRRRLERVAAALES